MRLKISFVGGNSIFVTTSDNTLEEFLRRIQRNPYEQLINNIIINVRNITEISIAPKVKKKNPLFDFSDTKLL